MNEMLRPMIDRVFALMLRNDMLAVPPDILQGRDVDIDYVSPLARAQKSSSLNGTMKALEILLPLAQSLPVGDHLNLFPQAQVEQTRQQRATAEQEQMQRQQDTEDVYTAAQAAQAVRMVSDGSGS
jgi:hypothetical protein